jgi:osmoprotectant transport system permease protein
MNGGAGNGSGLAPVIGLLVVAGVLAALFLGFLGVAPNRLLSPRAVMLWQAAPARDLALLAVGLALIVAGALLNIGSLSLVALLAGATLVLFMILAAGGEAATRLTAEAGSDSARVSLGGAFWVVFGTAALAVAEALRRLPIGQALRFLYGGLVLALMVLMASRGWFDDLSLVREWANRRGDYNTAVVQHVVLVVTSIAISLAVGIPLGIWATVRRRAAGTIFTLLNIIQTIPSIALFGLLIGPLTALANAVPLLRAAGVGGIGFTPAVIALVLYGLLPIARNVYAGLTGVPRSTIDAARGMGMSSMQITAQVAVPLALPALLAGIRIVAVQTIGMGVVAALIGAGGLGSFVFLGIGQTATDLVLLGALSAILMALVADAALRLVSLALTRRTPA